MVNPLSRMALENTDGSAAPAGSYDFHCHSSASDGTLSPSELVDRAAERGVRWLALTDHDSLAGLEEAEARASQHGLTLVNGIELSVRWNARELHLVGLGFDRDHPALTELVAQQQQAREARARRMGDRLDRAAPMVDSYDKAVALSGQCAPGRPWFARVLHGEGHVRSLQHAFNRFLKPGQVAYVSTPWTPLETAVSVIAAAGGVSVLAHPTRYGLTRRKLRALLADFVTAGGTALEVAVPGLNANQQQLMRECLRDFPLAASGGSDFHSPEQTWLDLGKVPPLPDNARPVWQAAGAEMA